MPCLEILQLSLREGVTAAAALENFIKIRHELNRRARPELGDQQLNSQYYQCIEDPSLIYVLGLWPSLKTHRDFAASPLKGEILSLQAGQTKFGWMVHMDLEGGMEDLPLDASVMAISRFFGRPERHDADFEKIRAINQGTFNEATKSWGVVHGWRTDCEAGQAESIEFTGWESVEAHTAFLAKAKEDPEFITAADNIEVIEIKHARNLER